MATSNVMSLRQCWWTVFDDLFLIGCYWFTYICIYYGKPDRCGIVRNCSGETKHVGSKKANCHSICGLFSVNSSNSFVLSWPKRFSSVLWSTLDQVVQKNKNKRVVIGQTFLLSSSQRTQLHVWPYVESSNVMPKQCCRMVFDDWPFQWMHLGNNISFAF